MLGSFEGMGDVMEEDRVDRRIRCLRGWVGGWGRPFRELVWLEEDEVRVWVMRTTVEFVASRIVDQG